MKLKSYSLQNTYAEWSESAAAADVALVDSIFHACEDHYDNGGDVVVECFGPEEILEQFTTVAEALDFCDVRREGLLDKCDF